MKIKPPIRILLALTSFILIVNSCSDSPTNGPNRLEECNSDLIVSVSEALLPHLPGSLSVELHYYMFRTRIVRELRICGESLLLAMRFPQELYMAFYQIVRL